MNRKSARVFLIDDHPLFRRGLAGLLSRHTDLKVCGEAESGTEALKVIQKLKPELAVVDLSLKGESGLDLIRQFRDIVPQTAIVVLSMHAEPHHAERSMRAGARGYVTKSESPEGVVSALRQVLDGKTYLSDEMRTLVVERFFGDATTTSVAPEDVLSKRELEVFRLLGQGNDTRRVAELMGLSIKTVQTFCAKAREKLHLASGAELLREAVRWADANATG